MADAIFESNWQQTKEALCDGLQGNKKVVMETTLENTRTQLMETATAGASHAGNVATLNKVIFASFDVYVIPLIIVFSILFCLSLIINVPDLFSKLLKTCSFTL